MQGLQTGQFPVGWSLWWLERDQTHAFEALEHPAQRRPIRWLLELVGDRLAGGGEVRTQPVLGEPIDQEAQDHDQAERHDAGRFLHEDGGGQKQWGL